MHQGESKCRIFCCMAYRVVLCRSALINSKHVFAIKPATPHFFLSSGLNVAWGSSLYMSTKMDWFPLLSQYSLHRDRHTECKGHHQRGLRSKMQGHFKQE